MRIGLFCSSLPEPERKPGGVDVFVDQLATQLAERGHEVTMYSFTKAAAGACYGSVALQPAARAHSKFARMTLVPLALNRLDTSRLDVLHLHGDDWFYASRSVPTVRTFHGSALHEARTATAWKRRLSQFATYGLEIAASRLATSSYMGAPDQGAAYRPAGVLPYAVDVPATAPIERGGAPSILFVGTWAGRKRGAMLFDIFRREVLPHVPDAELHMVSDECPQAPGVIWWDRPSSEQLRSLYQRAWVFCLPSSYEGFGLPYAEAMAQGTPVVATTNPGAEFVLAEGAGGMIVDDARIGDQIVSLLGDEALRRQVAGAGRRRVESFSWDAAVRSHEAAYAQAIADWSPRPA